jgi:Ser/Thr protein kinase RdoA (MazF antagonist)
MIESVLSRYGIPDDSLVQPLVSGLINHTWKVSSGEESYILQRINDHVFKQPYQLAENIQMINEYLTRHAEGYLFVAPLTTINGDTIVSNNEGYFRLFRFVQGSHTIDVVSSPEQAFEASQQFGKFTRLLSGFQAKKLHTTIPDFHNLTLRYKQFEDAVRHGNPVRVRQAATLIEAIKEHVHILNEYEAIRKSTYAKQRVIHHDTKISNVLFDDHGKGMCVIDLDTVMPGYFISDVGDMLRTYLSPANEEEKDFDKIEVRDEFFQAIVQGYLVNMGEELTSEEKGLLLYAGMFLIYMQAIRFLADFCNNDIYYGARYEDHNLVRAGNQVELLHRLEEKKEKLLAIVAAEFKTGNYVKS